MAIEYDVHHEESVAEKEALDSEENLPPVVLPNEFGEGEPKRVLKGKYRDVKEVEIFFQQRKLVKELRKLEKLKAEYELELEAKQKKRDKLDLNKKTKKALNLNKQKDDSTQGQR